MMSQSIENQTSAEDLQLLDANSLGSPLGVYRLKSGYIRFFRWSGQFMFILGILIFLLMIADWFRYQQDGSPEPFLESPQFFLGLLPGLSVLIGWLFLLCFGIPQARSERVIVCEQGLLHVERKVRGNHVDVVHWQDILAITKGLVGLEYGITYQAEVRAKTLDLSWVYQNFDELIALIRQQVAEAETRDKYL